MPSFREAIKRDISRVKFVEEQAKKKVKRKPKKAPKTPKAVKEIYLPARDVRALIMSAANQLKQIMIIYKKETTGEVKRYRVSPYSYRYRRLKTGVKKMFFAYDMTDKHIKGFVLKNIRTVEVLSKRYRPKWPVELASWKWK